MNTEIDCFECVYGNNFTEDRNSRGWCSMYEILVDRFSAKGKLMSLSYYENGQNISEICDRFTPKEV